MEKKKLLIVAVSVGVVLLIIIAIPLLMIIPRQNIAASANDVQRDWVTAIEPGPQMPPELVEPQTIQADRARPAENIPVQPEATSHITLTVPIPQTAAVPDVQPAVSQRTAAPRLEPVAAKPAPVAKQVQSPAPAPAPKEPAKSAVKPAAKPAVSPAKTQNNYWVQTGAFSTMVRAEGAKESLASKGITSVIDNRDIEGKTWYRVRVGPYVTETEANYWLALVKSIDGFGNSQIRLTQALR